MQSPSFTSFFCITNEKGKISNVQLLLRFCNIPHLGVFLASMNILWPVAISMDLIRIVGLLVTLFSFFIRGVVVFKGLEIE